MTKKKRNNPKRSTTKLARDLTLVRQLYSMGKNVNEIAEECGIHWKTAKTDIEKVVADGSPPVARAPSDTSRPAP